VKLLVIGHVWPQPNATAAGEHIMHLISFFKEMNYEVLFTTAAQKPEGYTELNATVINSRQIKMNDASFDDVLANFDPSIVLFDRFITEEQFSWRVHKNCPNAIRILDTEDLHFLRNQRLEAIKGKQTEGLSDIFKREIASIYRSDLSLIISLTEIQLLTETYQVPKELLAYLPLLHQGKLPEFTGFHKRKDLLFIGNFLHLPNWNCVQYLKKMIWPLVSKKLPGVKLHIYGSHASEKHLQLSNTKERFIVHGYANDLEALFNESKLLLAPLQFGAGQKGKLLKAMQYGLPNVTTPVGAEGMVFNQLWAGAICNTVNEIVSHTVLLYNNQSNWEEAQEKCEQIITQNFDYESHFSAFKLKVKTLQEKLDLHRQSNITGAILWHHSHRSTEFMSRWIEEKNKK